MLLLFCSKKTVGRSLDLPIAFLEQKRGCFCFLEPKNKSISPPFLSLFYLSPENEVLALSPKKQSFPPCLSPIFSPFSLSLRLSPVTLSFFSLSKRESRRERAEERESRREREKRERADTLLFFAGKNRERIEKKDRAGKIVFLGKKRKMLSFLAEKEIIWAERDKREVFLSLKKIIGKTKDNAFAFEGEEQKSKVFIFLPAQIIGRVFSP